MKTIKKMSQSFRKHFAVVIICIMIVGLAYGALFRHYKRFDFELQNDAVYKIESKLLDLKLNLRGMQETSKKVGILAIDERSLAQFGRWPISRRYYAKAFKNLKRLGVQWIGFDSIYSEPEMSYLHDIEKEIEKANRGARWTLAERRRVKQLLRESQADKIFVSSIKHFENIVLGYFSFHMEREAQLNLGDSYRYKGLETMLSSEIGADFPEGFDLNSPQYKHIIPKAYGIVTNTPFISSASEHFAFFSNNADDDAINRWVTLVANINGSLMPSLALKTVAEYLNREIFVFFDELGIETIVLVNRDDESDAIEVPIDPIGAGRILVNHRGPSQTFKHFSLADAYNDSFTPEQRAELKNSLLLLGATATGINDMRPNPFDPSIDGVENHAAVIDNIIKGDFIQRPQSIYPTEILIVFGVGVLFAPLLIWGNALISGLGMVGFLVGYYYIDKYIWFANGIWTYMAIPTLEIALMYITTTLYKYMTEEREKRKVKGAFQHYLSPEVINQVLENPDSLSLGGEKKELTVFFSDVRSFTTISESLTPEKLCELMNEYFTPMTSIVLRSKGVLDKYIGDAIMAFWGAPLELENSADVGCHAAIAMLYELDRLREEFPKKGFPTVDIGIGLNTGPMSVGNMGSGERFTYTVMGDAVNLGSRLEGLTKEYGIKIMISEFTKAKLTPGKFLTRDLDDIRVKGKNEPVNVFDLMRPDFLGSISQIQEFIGHFEAGRRYYKQQDWHQAKLSFMECLKMKPDDKAAGMYITRTMEYLEHAPGEHWDGVYTFTHK